MIYPAAKELVYLDSQTKGSPFNKSLILCLSMFAIVCALLLWPVFVLVFIIYKLLTLINTGVR